MRSTEGDGKSRSSAGPAASALAAKLREIRGEVPGETFARQIGIGYTGRRATSTLRARISAWESGTRIPNAESIDAYAARSGVDGERLRAMANEARTERATLRSPLGTREETSSESVRRGRGAGRRGILIVAASILVLAATVAVALWPHKHPSPRLDKTWTETTGTPARVWSDYKIAGGKAGQPLGPHESVQVSCRIQGFVVPDGDPWWYRLASTPWSNAYYATSDAFYNNGSTTGPVDDGVVVDEQVPVCAA